jgi:hypothetical protein
MSCSGCRWLVSRSVSVTSRSILADVTRYFSRCHPNAPFLYVDYDSDLDRVRSSRKLLLDLTWRSSVSAPGSGATRQGRCIPSIA